MPKNNRCLPDLTVEQPKSHVVYTVGLKNRLRFTGAGPVVSEEPLLSNMTLIKTTFEADRPVIQIQIDYYLYVFRICDCNKHLHYIHTITAGAISVSYSEELVTC